MLLGTVFPSVIIVTPLSLLTGLHGTIGTLVSRPFPLLTFFLRFNSFVLLQVDWRAAFTRTVTSYCPARPSANTSLTMTLKLSRHRLSDNLPTALSNRTGRSWFTWPMHTSQKNRCLTCSGFCSHACHTNDECHPHQLLWEFGVALPPGARGWTQLPYLGTPLLVVLLPS